MAGKGGGAWKVAYADFVTAMMAFFLVMWIVGQSKAVKQAVAQYFNEPSKSKKAPTESDGEPAPAPSKPGDGSSLLRIGNHASEGNRIVPNLKAKPGGNEGRKGEKAQKPSLFVLHDGDRRSAGTVILFPEASAELNDAARERLKQVVPMLLGKRNKVEIRGHTSRRPLPPGTAFQNAWQLSYARCVATMEYLEKAGVEPERIRLSQAGVFEPQTIRADAQTHAQNSRVEVTMLAEFVEDMLGTSKERAERVRDP
jgi:chemotaxis protein MotB